MQSTLCRHTYLIYLGIERALRNRSFKTRITLTPLRDSGQALPLSRRGRGNWTTPHASEWIPALGDRNDGIGGFRGERREDVGPPVLFY